MASSTETDLETLKSDFAALNQTVAELSRDVRSLLAAEVKDSGEKAKSGFDDSVAGLRERLEEIRGRGKQYFDTAEQKVGEHPYTSLVTAFGIGFILAKLLDLGRSR